MNAETQTVSGWPTKGYEGPQPWDLEAQGIERPQIGTGEGQMRPGAPNDVAPVVLDHGRPILATGSGGPDVIELCRLLGELGYETSYTRGENPFAILSNDDLAVVRHFRADYGVEEDPSGFGGDEQLAAAHVGPWTWEALSRASEDEPVEVGYQSEPDETEIE